MRSRRASDRRPVRRARPAALTGAVSVLLLAGCAAQPLTPDLTALYSATASDVDGVRNPLVVAPGTLGARLRHGPSGEVIWGGRSFSADPDTAQGFARLALPVGDGARPLAELTDDVEPAGLLDRARVRFLGGVIEEEVYGGIVRTLSAGGYRPPLGAAPPLRRLLDDSIGRGVRVLARARPAADPSADPSADPAAAPSLDPAPIAAAERSDGAARVAVAAARSDADEAAAAAGPRGSFVFTYDWRRDLVETARQLHRELTARRDRIRAETGRTVRFDLVAHSMGGLAVRYFMLYGDAPLPETGPLPPVTWAGADLVDKVVIVGAPHGGSVIAFENMVNGKSFSPLTPDFPAALIATHVSAYQLMPRVRHARVIWNGDRARSIRGLYDVALWDRYGWGLLAPSSAPFLEILLPDVPDPDRRRARARAHTEQLLRRAERFHRAIDVAAEPPADLDIFLVVGGGFRTPAIVSVDEVTGAAELFAREEGDGVVARASVLLDERVGGEFTPGLRSPLRFRATLFLPEEHVKLTQSEVFGDNLLFWLLEEPRRSRDADLAAPLLARDVLSRPVPPPRPTRRVRDRDDAR